MLILVSSRVTFVGHAKCIAKIERGESLTKDIFGGRGGWEFFSVFSTIQICVAKPE